MKKINKFEFMRNLQAWLTSSLFAFCLFYFVMLYLGEGGLLPWQTFVSISAVCLVLGIIMSIWQVSVGLILIIIVSLLIQIFMGFDFSIPFISAGFWKNIGTRIVEAANYLLYFSGPEESVRPENFLMIMTVTVSLLAVLTHWILPVPLLNLIFLIGPLFFCRDLANNKFCIFYLLAGLFCVYASYAYRQDPENRDQRPPISFGLILICLTFLLQSIIPPDFFFFEDLSKRLNNIHPMEGGEVESFSLKELGFYPQKNLKVGGPAKPSQATYLSVLAPSYSFYLRGSAYDSFDGNSWSKKGKEKLLTFDWDENYFDNFSSPKSKIFWFPNAENRDKALNQSLFMPSIYMIKTAKDNLNVFHSGKPALLSQLSKAGDPIHDTNSLKQAMVDTNSTSNFFYSTGGSIISATNYRKNGVALLDHVIPTGNVLSGQAFDLYPVDREEGERKYADIVKEKDPGLYEIVYESDLDIKSLIRKMREHFESDYQYYLECPEIPEKEGFIDNFLTNRKGYCVYFASAYSILLNDIGYKTRYVEGFLLPQVNQSGPASDSDQSGKSSDVLEINQETKNVLSLNNELYERNLNGFQAHAWIEIYSKDANWLPVETTPSSHISLMAGFESPNNPDESYDRPEDSSDLPNESSDDLAESSSSDTPIDESNDDETSNDANNDDKSLKTPLSALYENLWLILFSAAIILIVISTYDRIKMSRWADRQNPAKLLSKKVTNDVVFRRLYSELMRLAKLDGLTFRAKDTVYTSLMKIMDHYSYKSEEVEDKPKLIRSMEAIRYGQEDIDPEFLIELHKLYLKASSKRRADLSKFKWRLKEVWATPLKPW